MGRVFMQQLDDPFAIVMREIDALNRAREGHPGRLPRGSDIEKAAMGWHLDGKVTAVVGTHTHVQTADERILPGDNTSLTSA